MKSLVVVEAVESLVNGEGDGLGKPEEVPVVDPPDAREEVLLKKAA